MLKGKDILSIDQFDLSTINRLFLTAEQLEKVAKGQVRTTLLDGAILANLFFEASTRTRMSFHTAFSRLGGTVSDTTGFSFSSISKGESLADTAKVMSEYADVIVMRHPNQGAVSEFAKYATVPVINGGDGPGEHPTQALLDLYTIEQLFKQRQKAVDGSTVVLSGDLKNGRTVHSLAKLLNLFKQLTFHLVAPTDLSMPKNILQLLRENGHRVVEFTQPKEALNTADVIYCTRIQKERIEEDSINENTLFTIDKLTIDQYARKDSVILHPLPRDSRPGAFDLSTDLDNDERLKIFQQAANGIPVRMALFIHCLGLENQVKTARYTPNDWS